MRESARISAKLFVREDSRYSRIELNEYSTEPTRAVGEVHFGFRLIPQISQIASAINRINHQR